CARSNYYGGGLGYW
nr:immunoglobulin heavy chain junction region [Macaca mulatta]